MIIKGKIFQGAQLSVSSEQPNPNETNVWYNPETKTLYVWNGEEWQTVSSHVKLVYSEDQPSVDNSDQCLWVKRNNNQEEYYLYTNQKWYRLNIATFPDTEGQSGKYLRINPITNQLEWASIDLPESLINSLPGHLLLEKEVHVKANETIALKHDPDKAYKRNVFVMKKEIEDPRDVDLGTDSLCKTFTQNLQVSKCVQINPTKYQITVLNPYDTNLSEVIFVRLPYDSNKIIDENGQNVTWELYEGYALIPVSLGAHQSKTFYVLHDTSNNTTGLNLYNQLKHGAQEFVTTGYVKDFTVLSPYYIHANQLESSIVSVKFQDVNTPYGVIGSDGSFIRVNNSNYVWYIFEQWNLPQDDYKIVLKDIQTVTGNWNTMGFDWIDRNTSAIILRIWHQSWMHKFYNTLEFHVQNRRVDVYGDGQRLGTYYANQNLSGDNIRFAIECENHDPSETYFKEAYILPLNLPEPGQTNGRWKRINSLVIPIRQDLKTIDPARMFYDGSSSTDLSAAPIQLQQGNVDIRNGYLLFRYDDVKDSKITIEFDVSDLSQIEFFASSIINPIIHWKPKFTNQPAHVKFVIDGRNRVVSCLVDGKSAIVFPLRYPNRQVEIDGNLINNKWNISYKYGNTNYGDIQLLAIKVGQQTLSNFNVTYPLTYACKPFIPLDDNGNVVPYSKATNIVMYDDGSDYTLIQNKRYLDLPYNKDKNAYVSTKNQITHLVSNLTYTSEEPPKHARIAPIVMEYVNRNDYSKLSSVSDPGIQVSLDDKMVRIYGKESLDVVNGVGWFGKAVFGKLQYNNFECTVTYNYSQYLIAGIVLLDHDRKRVYNALFIAHKEDGLYNHNVKSGDVVQFSVSNGTLVITNKTSGKQLASWTLPNNYEIGLFACTRYVGNSFDLKCQFNKPTPIANVTTIDQLCLNTFGFSYDSFVSLHPLYENDGIAISDYINTKRVKTCDVTSYTGDFDNVVFGAIANDEIYYMQQNQLHTTTKLLDVQNSEVTIETLGSFISQVLQETNASSIQLISYLKHSDTNYETPTVCDISLRLYTYPIYRFENESNYDISLVSPTQTVIKNLTSEDKDWRVLITVPQYEYTYEFSLDNNETKIIELPLATNVDGAILNLKEFKPGQTGKVDVWTMDVGTESDWIMDNPDNVVFENGYVTLKYWRINND